MMLKPQLKTSLDGVSWPSPDDHIEALWQRLQGLEEAKNVIFERMDRMENERIPSFENVLHADHKRHVEMCASVEATVQNNLRSVKMAQEALNRTVAELTTEVRHNETKYAMLSEEHAKNHQQLRAEHNAYGPRFDAALFSVEDRLTTLLKDLEMETKAMNVELDHKINDKTSLSQFQALKDEVEALKPILDAKQDLIHGQTELKNESTRLERLMAIERKTASTALGDFARRIEEALGTTSSQLSDTTTRLDACFSECQKQLTLQEAELRKVSEKVVMVFGKSRLEVTITDRISKLEERTSKCEQKGDRLKEQLNMLY